MYTIWPTYDFNLLLPLAPLFFLTHSFIPSLSKYFFARDSAGAGPEEWFWFCPRLGEFAVLAVPGFGSILPGLWAFSLSGSQMLEWTISLISQSLSIQGQGPALLGLESFSMCLVMSHCPVVAKLSVLIPHYRKEYLSSFHLLEPSMVCQSTWKERTTFYSSLLSQLLAQSLTSSRNSENE